MLLGDVRWDGLTAALASLPNCWPMCMPNPRCPFGKGGAPKVKSSFSSLMKGLEVLVPSIAAALVKKSSSSSRLVSGFKS